MHHERERHTHTQRKREREREKERERERDREIGGEERATERGCRPAKQHQHWDALIRWGNARGISG